MESILITVQKFGFGRLNNAFEADITLQLIHFFFACSTPPPKDNRHCSEEYILKLQHTAFDAKINGDNNLSRDTFLEMCECGRASGCVNAAGFYNEKDPKWWYLTNRACDLGYGNACFWLGEFTKDEIAQGYYEKGCSLSEAMACRMAAVHNIGDYNKASSYYEKGCLLGDITSCIEAFKMIKDPIRKQRIKDESCDIGIPEVCDDSQMK